MSRQLLQRAQRAMKTATRLGAQGVRVAIGRERRSTLEWRDGRLDRIRESTQLALHLTLFVDGRYSSNSTSDLRANAVSKFIEETIAQTRLLARDPARGLAPPARYGPRTDANLQLHDPRVAQVAPDRRRQTARELEAAARAAPGHEGIVSVSSSWSDTVAESALVCSNGMEGTTKRTICGFDATVTVADAGGRKPRGSWLSWSRHLGSLDAVEPVGREAIRRAREQIGATPAKTGTYACVIENAAAGGLVGALLGPLWGSAVQQRQSFLGDKLGQQVASPALTITDDPHLAAGFGSRTYDAEGMATKPRVVMKGGVVKSFFLDTYYARKLKRRPTSGQQTNLIFAHGTRDLAGLLKEMDRGLLITGFIGGNSNSATGDFSFGVRGHLIEGGQPTRPITEMNLSGNHLTFWKRLLETGNDPFRFSSVRVPSLRFDTVQFSGA